MTEKLLAIIDNGQRVRGECNDCGASLRYEYVTDAGVYGSECVHAHIHRPDWMTLKGRRDAAKWAAIKKALDALAAEISDKQAIEYIEFRDGSIYIFGVWNHYISCAIDIFVHNLIESGWTKSNVDAAYSPQSKKYTLARPGTQP